jgi:hypothetical protein
VRSRRSGLWIHYSLAPSRSALHRRVLAGLAASADEVAHAEADARRYAIVKTSSGCCPR